MKYERLKRALRTRVRSGRIWSVLRSALVTYQYLARDPDEPELRLFGVLEQLEAPVFVDIGANGGQTAVAIARILPNARIESFEPQPQLQRELRWVRRLIGPRFRATAVGLGSETATMAFHVPYLRNLPVTTRANLDPTLAADRARELNEETGLSSDVRELAVEIRRFDDLGIDPHGVKIDVEGTEHDVLTGMKQTLRRCQPLLMIEYSDHTPACRALLAELGYDFWDLDLSRSSLRPAGDPQFRNWFAVPPRMDLRQLLPLIS